MKSFPTLALTSLEVIDTLRTTKPRFKPWVFAEGSSTVKIGEPPARIKVLKAQRSAKL